MHIKVDAEVINVSKGGMSIECTEKLERGKVYTVTLLWCGNVLDVKCEVVWILDNGSAQKYRSGMNFIQIDKDNVSNFLTCLEEHVADARRLNPRMKVTGTRAVLSYH
ncbi:MAG TPA: PilZ domain-containing protein [Thermodesulfovibrionales bacterium]|nr:PilZ domain-containing protein [Thermodesulfovibrionales bacterium]